MLQRFNSHWLQASALALLLISLALPVAAQQGESDHPESTALDLNHARKLRVKVLPSRPELARRFKISGIVRLQITVAPNGTVQAVKAIGGHPALIDSAVAAVKEWKYEPSARPTTDLIEITFQPAS